jgi:hypothetical protein
MTPNGTLLLSPRLAPDSERIREAAIQGGYAHRRLDSFRPPNDLSRQPIFVYGEPLFTIIVTQALNHVLIEPTYNWLATLPTTYTGRDIISATMEQARSLKQPRFVKLADGMKGFEARVYRSGADLPHFYEDDLTVLVQEPVRWTVEYRCFVLNRQITTMSVYLREGSLAQDAKGDWRSDPETDAAARAFCEYFLADDQIALPPACVVDVGLIEGRGWAVIEANPAYGSGLYGCDASQVLPVLQRACRLRDHTTDEDHPWVMPYVVEG